MTKLRSSLCCIAVLVLGLSAACSAGVVSIDATAPEYVMRGCQFTITVDASDCDEYDCLCCSDELIFPDWTLDDLPRPERAGSVYHREYTLTCTWTGPRSFTFRADDLHSCPPPYEAEDDDEGVDTITITGVEIAAVSILDAPVVICPCPKGNVTFTAITNPPGYEHLIGWSGGGVPETGTGGEFSTYWETAGAKTVSAGCNPEHQIQVDVAEPYYQASFIDIPQPVGGTESAKFQLRTRCVTANGLEVEARHTALDPWRPLTVLSEVCVTQPDGNGISTITYPLVMWDTINRVLDGSVYHNLDRNDPHELQARALLSVCPYAQQFEHIQAGGGTVKNLTIESTDPEGVVFWTGEEGTTVPITVNIEDNDLTDPVTLTLKLYNTGDDNRGEFWSPSAVLQQGGITAESHTFNWNGTSNGTYGDLLPAGTYTFEVIATQTNDTECLNCLGADAGCDTEDTETYRSEYLKIIRATDAGGNPIHDVDLVGYDNNTPDDDTDDKYIYTIRRYRLEDTLGVNASEGVIWLYGPDGQRRGDPWDIADLDCVEHNKRDGLHVGKEHALRLRVPVSSFDYAGTYRFVIHIKDAHAERYRNSENRWALDLNCEHDVHTFTVWMYNDKHDIGADAGRYGRNVAARVRKLGYAPCKPEGDPAEGGTGRLYGVYPRLTIRTLDRLSPTDPPWQQMYCTKSAIWMYAGHGEIYDGSLNTTYLQFVVTAGNGGIYVGAEDPDEEIFNIDAFDLDPVRLAYLMACYSAGGTKPARPGQPTAVTAARGNSIAAHFDTAGTTGARSVIGFREILYAGEKPYDEFHNVFWNAVCKGMTVGQAFHDAAKAANKIVRDDMKKNGAKAKYKPFFPDLFGHRGVILSPPRYGDEKSFD